MKSIEMVFMKRKNVLPRNPLILCCHGVYDRGEIYSEFPEDKPIFENQLRESIRNVQTHVYDLLIISGGFTKKELEKSEAQGMVDWASDLRLNIRKIPFILEEYARDSFENTLFSMCRFYQEYNQFPEGIGVCSWKFKEPRFRIFADALFLPNYSFVGVGNRDNLTCTEPELLEMIRDDPFQRNPALVVKRNGRNPWGKSNPYAKINIFKKMFYTLDLMEEKGLTDPLLVDLPWN